MVNQMFFMGIDIGSSGCKVSVVDEKGNIIKNSSKNYSFTYEGNTIELSPEMVYESTVEAIRAITDENPSLHIDAISAASFGEMVVLLDENDKVLTNSISYSDLRGQSQIREFSKEFGEDNIYSVTGTTPDAMYSLAKLLWFKENRRDIFSKTKKICLFADFILQKFGADYHMDYSLASRTQMFDITHRCWSDEIVSRLGIDKSILPPLVPSGTPVGTISKKASADLGIEEGTLILAGGHDQCFASLGAGIIHEGMALDGMGSNECVVPVFSTPMINETMKESSFACVPYLLEGKYVTYAFNRTSGSVIDWYKKLRQNISYDELFENIENSPSRVLFLPHFAGAATPYMDDDATGAIAGLDLSVTPDEVTKGIIDGLNYEIKINLDALKKAGHRVSKLYVSGGLSKNDKVLQTKADILGMDVCRLETSQAGTVAVAILGSVAKGIYSDIERAVEKIVRIDKIFTPDMENHKKYALRYEKYKKMYENIKNITKRN
ncbi:MAG: hypothetical protein E7394_04085 [Ruminococcaceae bacterium]|nr:hypothetical protein [Oscillospiraceae bacterium]